MQNVILTDCDGVLVNWSETFNAWLGDKGYVRLCPDRYFTNEQYGISREEADLLITTFNESVYIEHLGPILDAINGVRCLHENHGFIFRVITCLGTNQYAWKLRERNLERLFGSAIESVICLPRHNNKHEELSKYKNQELFWIEDSPLHATIGGELGLQSLLIRHDYNSDAADGALNYRVVNNWNDIVTIVTEGL